MESSEYDLLLDLILEIKQGLADLFQSGFITVHDITIKRIRNLSDVSEQYGLHTASQMLLILAQLIENRRHTTNYDGSEIMDVMCKIRRYIEICEKRIRYENILNNYSKFDNKNINN